MLRHSASLMSSSGPGRTVVPPALATKMSTGPRSCSIMSRMASICFVAGEVRDRSEGTAAGFLDVGDHGLDRIGVATMDYDGSALFGEESGYGGPDTARASGHQCDTARPARS